MDADEELAARLGRNIKLLRAARGMTQQQMARLSGLPRATWANLESGAANPTLAVLHKVAFALQVPIEELIAQPRALARHYPAGSLPERRRGEACVRTLLPDKVPGVVLERIALPQGERLVGTPHTPGTREYLTCEQGALSLRVEGALFQLAPGDVVVFRGDQRHSYENAGRAPCVGYSVVLLQPVD